jgi:thymidine kinase
MRLTIKSRREIETISGTEKPVFHFWMQDSGGYVRLESNGRPGTLGQQICHGGKLGGNTVYAIPETFEAVCRRWYRNHMRREAASD